ncbi:MAG: glutamine--tRNA ligase/YqeY domain fusion protein [Ardenticatenia bacterium]|nr:glutamine--tRNA ligase/YqeY domain fusion protein [Ardenticatenia bacterium]
MSEPLSTDFIHEIVTEDLAAGKCPDGVVTRFPPEPNGYLHLGHAKAICVDFGVATDFGGRCRLRFDDTNPTRENQDYVDAIERDVRWLGFEPDAPVRFTSDYFEQLFQWALALVDRGRAYVCELSAEDLRLHRGSLSEPGRDSPWRDRSADENRRLLLAMRAGDFPEGSRTLRAKIDMAAPNLHLRDPVMYRILRASHHRTGDAWSVYPSYDWAHGQSDAIEGVTHSLCTLEFEDHRALYDWFLTALDIERRPRQIEFARFNLSHSVMSKRKLKRVVEEGLVRGWDDPRLPTLAGLRRRGCPPEAIVSFCEGLGVTRRESMVELARLDHAVRERLNLTAPRALAVLDPLKVVIDNVPEGEVRWFETAVNPEDPAAGMRRLPFSREIYIDRADFMLEPPPKYHRLSPGTEVRLRSAYILRCDHVETDPSTGAVTLLHGSIDPDSSGGQPADGRKIKGTIHWLSAAHALPAEVRLYEPLFTAADPEATDDADLLAAVNPESLTVIERAWVEPNLADAAPGERFQFERVGYFAVDPDSGADGLVFNRIVGLRDSWSKAVARG